ncbi:MULTISPECIES: beta-propeller fold lactonase family protein [Arthrobacter]|uniref:Beta-propeller fold lactonase family protein n=2 Tax=Arthrobacter TaxID=1663 RepID=A0ABU9KIG8_9MICC|nr:beta-propeller fold lactonase family protein [Arthrobacter sp. YJM1]MDP5226303.1 beta-propeller fold lactonase family protein [Arthrobacter sp. YJM1]
MESPQKPSRPWWRRSAVALGTAACLTVGGTAALAGLALTQHAGPQADGTGITPAGWAVTPAGDQRAAGYFPANTVTSPDGSAVVVPNIVVDENGKQTVQVLSSQDGSLLQQLELNGSDGKTPQGVAPGAVFSPDGKQLYLATANKNAVLVLDWDAAAHKLSVNRSLKLPSGSYPQTVAVSPDGKTVYATGQLSRKLIAVDVATGQTATAPTGDYPFGVILSADGGTAYVSNQGGNTLSTFTVAGLTLTKGADVTVGTHPNNMLLDTKNQRIYVSNGDNDTVSVLDARTGKVQHTLSVAPYQGAPGGTQPTNLALSPDTKTLYVTAGGNNDVTVLDVSGEDGFGKVKGLIPTGWYPTGVAPSKDGKRLLIASAKGLGTGPNKGTDPANSNNHPYIERQLKGFVTVVPTPDGDQLAKFTQQVRRNNGVDGEGGAVNQGQQGEQGRPGTVVPRTPGQASPIKHVIYVVKENRTYDQVFGDMPKGNGDPSLAIFGKDVTPNLHKLADKFVTLDNLYADGEVSQNGWQWATQASSNPYNETGTAQGYAGNGSQYDSEGEHPYVAAAGPDPEHAYLWDKLAQKDVSFRNFGQFVVPPREIDAAEPVKCTTGFCAHDPILNAQTNHDYPWFDMSVSDQKRFDIWNKDFQGFKSSGTMPSMQFIDLPRDHTAGAGTAAQLVADNDLALGKIVDEVSHSQFWKDTAIFVVEDDAQGGPDHVDAHRTTGLVISPYTQTGTVDSHFYSQVSMLRTMELFLGVQPMSQYDAAAMPMIYSFGKTANSTPYDAVAAPSLTLSMPNPVLAAGASSKVTATVSNTGHTTFSGSKATLGLPQGWTATPDAQQPLNDIAPGQTATTSWTVTVPAGAAPGQQMLTLAVPYAISGSMTGTAQTKLAAVVPDPRVATIPQAFVANFSSSTVSAVDLSTGQKLADIPVGANPGTVVVSPDHKRAYVANQNSGSVSVIDVASDAVIATLKTGSVPAGLAVSPDSKTLWVSEYGDNAVEAFSTDTGASLGKTAVGAGPENLSVTPDGASVVVANKSGNTVSVLDAATRAVRSTVTTGSQPFGVVVTPDSKTAFISEMGANSVLPVDLATGTVGTPIAAGQTPFNMVLSHDGATLYVADTGANTVTPIDVATRTAKAAWTVGDSITSVMLGADDATVYATRSGAGKLFPIATATGVVGAPITVGSYPISSAFAAPSGGSSAPLSPAPAATPLMAAAPATASSPSLTPSVNHSTVMTPEQMAGHPDQADAQKLNQEIWQAMRGADSTMPAPAHNLGAVTAADPDGDGK